MKGMPSSTGGAEPRSTVCLSRRRHTASSRVDPTATATWAARGRAWRAATRAWSWSAMDGHCSNPQQLGLRSGCLPGVGSMQCAALQTLQPPCTQMLPQDTQPVPAQQGRLMRGRGRAWHGCSSNWAAPQATCRPCPAMSVTSTSFPATGACRAAIQGAAGRL